MQSSQTELRHTSQLNVSFSSIFGAGQNIESIIMMYYYSPHNYYIIEAHAPRMEIIIV